MLKEVIYFKNLKTTKNAFKRLNNSKVFMHLKLWHLKLYPKNAFTMNLTFKIILLCKSIVIYLRE